MKRELVAWCFAGIAVACLAASEQRRLSAERDLTQLRKLEERVNAHNQAAIEHTLRFGYKAVSGTSDE
jgi:hypothetical protein